MSQSVWHRDDLARIGQVLITMAPSLDYAAGVAALCAAVGAQVCLPERNIEIEITYAEPQAIERRS